MSSSMGPSVAISTLSSAAGRVDARLQRPAAGRRSGPGVEDRELGACGSRRNQDQDDREQLHEQREHRVMGRHRAFILWIEATGQEAAPTCAKRRDARS